MRLIGPVNLDPELLERKVDHPALHVVGVHVDDGQDHIRIVGRALRVGQELLVLGEVKSQAAVALERRILAPDVVDDPHELTHARVALPVSQLVLLRIHVLLGAMFARTALQRFEGRAVDSVARAERGGQDQPGLERGPAAGLQVLGEDVGGVGPEVRPEEVANRRLGQFGEVLVQLVRGVAPREVRVRLAEPHLGEPVHDLRSRERLGKQDRLGVRTPQLGDQPLPEREGFGVRVVDPEHADPLLGPVEDDRQKLLPEPSPVLGLEVERVDVLVLLRRVFRVLDRAVGPVLEPLGMLARVGVIG